MADQLIGASGAKEGSKAAFAAVAPVPDVENMLWKIVAEYSPLIAQVFDRNFGAFTTG